MTEHSKIHERVFGAKKQNQDVWFLVKETDGQLSVLHERRVREKGQRQFNPVARNHMSVSQAMCHGGKLAKNLWYALPGNMLRN
jgi:uncharacterized membrane protein YcaP (DUF421 family)